jgi:hypothetical protein
MERGALDRLGWPGELIEQAPNVIMNRFDLGAADTLQVLRRYSQNARTQMCVVAEAIILHNVPDEVESEYIVDKAAHG